MTLFPVQHVRAWSAAVATAGPSYYNDTDPFACSWLRALMSESLIPPGEIDDRPIQSVPAADLRGFHHCHFFAGIAGWPYALALAEWPPERPVWTGSCPCPSFSVAGKGEGFSDPRHLWPYWEPLIRECRPPVVFGEQAPGAVGHGWLDLVSTDLEASDYAVGAAVLGACSVGAPHRRQRLYFVADTERGTAERRGFDVGKPARGAQREARQRERLWAESRAGVNASSVAEPLHPERRAQHEHREDGRHRENGRRAEAHGVVGAYGEIRGVDDATGTRHDGAVQASEGDSRDEARLRVSGEGSGLGSESGRPGPLNGFWRDADWIFCRDRRWRPVAPGTFPLATGLPNRVGRLRGAGNSIVPQVASELIRVFVEARQAEVG